MSHGDVILRGSGRRLCRPSSSLSAGTEACRYAGRAFPMRITPACGLRYFRLAVRHLSALALIAAVAAAQPARISGRVRQAGSAAGVANAQVKVEGPALAGRENSQVIKR